MKFNSRLFVYLFIVIFFMTSNYSVLSKTNLKKCLLMKNNKCVKTIETLGSKTQVIGVNKESGVNRGIGVNSGFVFKFDEPINKCKAEDCIYCCLSNNKCGKKSQCENSK